MLSSDKIFKKEGTSFKNGFLLMSTWGTHPKVFWVLESFKSFRELSSRKLWRISILIKMHKKRADSSQCLKVPPPECQLKLSCCRSWVILPQLSDLGDVIFEWPLHLWINLFKKRLLNRFFPGDFAKVFRTTILKNTSYCWLYMFQVVKKRLVETYINLRKFKM